MNFTEQPDASGVEGKEEEREEREEEKEEEVMDGNGVEEVEGNDERELQK